MESFLASDDQPGHLEKPVLAPEAAQQALTGSVSQTSRVQAAAE